MDEWTLDVLKKNNANQVFSVSEWSDHLKNITRVTLCCGYKRYKNFTSIIH